MELPPCFNLCYMRPMADLASSAPIAPHPFLVSFGVQTITCLGPGTVCRIDLLALLTVALDWQHPVRASLARLKRKSTYVSPSTPGLVKLPAPRLARTEILGLSQPQSGAGTCMDMPCIEYNGAVTKKN